MARKAKIKTIDVEAKEWFDRTYGNSYFSAQVTVNFGLPSQQTLYIPFQYGYGSSYEQAAIEALKKAGLFTVTEARPFIGLYSYCEENNIILRRNKTENCLKRDAKAFGEPR